jgi:hypothetical protein
MTSVVGIGDEKPEAPIPEAAVVCSNCSALSNRERLELGGG